MKRLFMHGMTLSYLQYLVAVAEEGNFLRAAERCHISQPTLSGQVKKFEAMLSPGGVALKPSNSGATSIADFLRTVSIYLAQKSLGILRD